MRKRRGKGGLSVQMYTPNTDGSDRARGDVRHKTTTCRLVSPKVMWLGIGSEPLGIRITHNPSCSTGVAPSRFIPLFHTLFTFGLTLSDSLHPLLGAFNKRTARRLRSAPGCSVRSGHASNHLRCPRDERKRSWRLTSEEADGPGCTFTCGQVKAGRVKSSQRSETAARCV